MMSWRRIVYWLAKSNQERMMRRHYRKFVHEGEYAAEVDVELIDSDEGWAPCLSLEDAEKLDDVRVSLRHGDLKRATKLGRVFV